MPISFFALIFKMANRLTIGFTTAQKSKYFSIDIDNIKEDIPE